MLQHGIRQEKVQVCRDKLARQRVEESSLLKLQEIIQDKETRLQKQQELIHDELEKLNQQKVTITKSMIAVQLLKDRQAVELKGIMINVSSITTTLTSKRRDLSNVSLEGSKRNFQEEIRQVDRKLHEIRYKECSAGEHGTVDREHVGICQVTPPADYSYYRNKRELEHQKEQLNKESDITKSKCSTLTTEIKILERQLEQVNVKKRGLESQVQNRVKELQNFQRNLIEIINRVNQLNSEIEQINNSKNRINIEKQALATKMQFNRNIIVRLETELTMSERDVALEKQRQQKYQQMMATKPTLSPKPSAQRVPQSQPFSQDYLMKLAQQEALRQLAEQEALKRLAEQEALTRMKIPSQKQVQQPSPAPLVASIQDKQQDSLLQFNSGSTISSPSNVISGILGAANTSKYAAAFVEDGFDVVSKGGYAYVKGARTTSAIEEGIKGTRYALENAAKHPEVAKFVHAPTAVKTALNPKTVEGKIGWAGVVLDTALDTYENVQKYEEGKIDGTKIVTDAAVDVAFGGAAIATCAAAGAAVCSVVPVLGTIAGTVAGTAAGVAYTVVTEVWEPGGQSIKDRAKDAVHDAVNVAIDGKE